MESLDKDHTSSDSSQPPSAACAEYAVPDVIITRRLRDRELLRKRKAEALEKESAQWVLRDYKSKQQKRGRRARRGQGRPMVIKTVLDPGPVVDPQPDPKEEAEPEPSELALPEPVYEEQPPMLTMEDVVSEMQPMAMEGELAARSLDPTGEEDVLKPAEAETQDELNSPLETYYQDN